MAGKLVGISSAGSALPSTEMSTDANDLTSGFDRIDPGSPSGRQTLDYPAPGAGGSINVSMPQDLQGPNGFNMERASHAAQNIVTDPNKTGVDAASPTFPGFDAPLQGGPSAGTSASSKDGLNDLGNDAQGGKPQY